MYDSLSLQEKRELVELLEAKARFEARKKFERLFPDETTVQHDGSIIHARRLYPRHMELFEAGARYRERCFMAANRIGKTVSGAYETTAHLTGRYPPWWPGRSFDAPVRWWAAGKTNETTRDIVQTSLLGDIATRDGRKSFTGTGMIPYDAIGPVTWKQGVADLADTVKVKHPSGGWSLLGFKSYQQGRGSFEGTAQHGVWLDEEPPLDIYGECLVRTATTEGLILITFTPLAGLSETVLQFMPSDMRPQE